MDKYARQVIESPYEIASPHYFKSSFARSMAVNCLNQSKSLDNAFLNPSRVNENLVCNTNRNETVWSSPSVNMSRNSKVLTEKDRPALYKTNTVLRSGCIVPQRKNIGPINQNNDTSNLWKISQDVLNDVNHQNGRKNNGLIHSPSDMYKDSDILRLRKECQNLLEENRRLQATLELRSTPLLNNRSLQAIDGAILQSQVNTLQWQLKQTESSRQMYRAVMEQVVRFLERAYKNLDLIKNKMDPGRNSNKSSPSRVPRSRSVHTVDVSPSRASPQSDSSHFPRAKSIAQIEASPNYSTFRDFTWRRPRQEFSDPDEVPPEKLSQEAFRLLRTAQSLLNTREPDLVQRLCPEMEAETIPDHNSSSSHRSSLSSSAPGAEDNLHTTHFQCNSIQKPDPVSSTGSCSSLLQHSLDATSLHSFTYNNNNSSLTSGLESAFAGGCSTSSLGRPQKCKSTNPAPEPSYIIRGTINNSPPVSSTEDESGFSSMNSFQEVGLPIVSPSPTPTSYSLGPKISPTYTEAQYQTNPEPSKESSYCLSGFQEIGLPVIEQSPNDNNSNNRSGTIPSHRRWSSSPAEALSHYSKQSASFCGTGETLKVLWV